MAEQKVDDGNISLQRLKAERSSWKKNHPAGFVAKPIKSKSTGQIDYYQWECTIPGIQTIYILYIFLI